MGGGGGWSKGGGWWWWWGGGGCRLRTMGLLGWCFCGMGTYSVNILDLHMALPPIHIKAFLSIGVNKILHTILYSCPCNERQ